MSTSPVSAQFPESAYTIRRKVFRLFGAGFQIFDPSGQLVATSEQKRFKLKEDIRLFRDEAQQQELLNIHARSWLDFSAAYDVVDSTTGEKVGGLKRKGLQSLVRDQWIIMDALDHDIGIVQEDSTAMALVRRFVPNGEFIPQKYSLSLNGQPVAELRQHFNPIVQRVTVDFSLDQAGQLDRRLGLAAGILLSAIEGRQ